MKKALSVFLAVVMMLSVFGACFGAFADYERPVAQCTCKNHNPNGPCHCCVYCPNLDKTYQTSCVKDVVDEEGNVVAKSFCCSKCTGIFPCSCGCECCNNFEDKDDNNDKPIFNEDQQEQIVNGFQAVLKKVADVFDMLFKAIFDFLRIGDLFPDLVK